MSVAHIYLHPDWILTRYSGWQVIHRDPECLLLQRGSFPFKRFCVLGAVSGTTIFSRHDVRAICRSARILTVKIMPPDPGAASLAAAHGLGPTNDRQRMFHRFTFVVNLTAPVDHLWIAMRPTNRNLCRKAQQLQVSVRVEGAAGTADLDRFFELYGTMARERHLAIPERRGLENMISDRRLVLGVAEKAGTVVSMALVYVAGDRAMYLHGVSDRYGADGAGQCLQWELMLALKARGICAYDLGGVPSLEEADGIYRFKKGFGGERVELGPEFHRTPRWLQAARGLRRWL